MDLEITFEVHLFSVRTCYVGAVRQAGELKEQGQGIIAVLWHVLPRLLFCRFLCVSRTVEENQRLPRIRIQFPIYEANRLSRIAQGRRAANTGAVGGMDRGKASGIADVGGSASDMGCRSSRTSCSNTLQLREASDGIQQVARSVCTEPHHVSSVTR